MSKPNAPLKSIVDQAQRMQSQIAKVQEQLADKEVETSVAGGAVKAIVNGKQELVKLEISSEVTESSTPDELAELLVSAVNLALQNSREMLEGEVNAITGGLNIPGLF
jgi:hypothetical protein